MKLCERFTTWPDDALQRVAEKFIRAMNLSGSPVAANDGKNVSEESVNKDGAAAEDEEGPLSEVEKSIIDVVMYFNVSIEEASAR